VTQRFTTDLRTLQHADHAEAWEVRQALDTSARDVPANLELQVLDALHGGQRFQ